MVTSSAWAKAAAHEGGPVRYGRQVGDIELVVADTDALSSAVLRQVRALMDVAFDDPDEPDEAFGDTDWDHALGGTHVLVLDGDGAVLSHASVVDRIIDVAGRPLRTGYVEAMATQPSAQGRGLGSRVMARIGEVIVARHQLGALATGVHPFYEQLGWERWEGPLFLRRGEEIVRTPEDDDAIMVLRVDRSLVPDLSVPISCDDRPGNVW